jgi:hypothetical protein
MHMTFGRLGAVDRQAKMSGMEGALPAVRTYRLPPLHVAAFWTAIIVANVWFLSWTLAEMVLTDSAADWHIITHAAQVAGTAALYADQGPATFPWSPLAAWLLIPVSALGLTGWRLLHVAAALALPSWPMRLLVLASWPFWFDVSLGNVLTFCLLAAAWALRGSRVATFAFFALTLLVPRPLMLPIAAWLLWKRPEWRLPFLGMAVVAAGGVLATGLADDWLRELLAHGSRMYDWTFNVAPSRWIGAWWLLAGIPLAGWLTWKGRVGLAALAVSPYLLPYYLMLPVLEVERR